MNRRLRKLKNKIFFGDYSDEEWREIEAAVKEELSKITPEEKKEFIDCGAGGLLAQIMEYMD